jgi:hypothetical protein
MKRISKLETLELQRKGALDLADALYNENERLKKQIERSDHNAKVLLKVADNEIARLKELFIVNVKNQTITSLEWTTHVGDAVSRLKTIR